VRLRLGVPKRRWVRLLLLFGGIPAVLGLLAVAYFWVSYGRMIDARLGDGEQRPIPRLFARPFELQPGRALDPTRLVQRPERRGLRRTAEGGAPRRILRLPRFGAARHARAGQGAVPNSES
jgi:hypothetical protein